MEKWELDAARESSHMCSLWVELRWPLHSCRPIGARWCAREEARGRSPEARAMASGSRVVCVFVVSAVG